MSQLSEFDKGRILELYKEGYGIRAISRVLGFSKATVHLWVKRMATEGQVTTRPRSGRPRTTTKDIDKKILRCSDENPYSTSNEIKNILKLGVSRSTIRRRIVEQGRNDDSVTTTYSDNGGSDGIMSFDEDTLAMYYLTPDVEVSVADAPPLFSPSQCEQPLSQSVSESRSSSQHLNGDCPCPGSQHSTDLNASSSNHNGKDAESVAAPPSISRIPIKQKPVSAADTGPFPDNISASSSVGEVCFRSTSSCDIPSVTKRNEEDQKEKFDTR